MRTKSLWKPLVIPIAAAAMAGGVVSTAVASTGSTTTASQAAAASAAAGTAPVATGALHANGWSKVDSFELWATCQAVGQGFMAAGASDYECRSVGTWPFNRYDLWVLW